MNEIEGFDPTEPSVARVWDYLLGGKDHYPADREEAERLLAIEPRLRFLARTNRGFLRRAVHWLALDCGVRQFLDLGSGLPGVGSTVHQVAQGAASASRVVYVDNDPVAATHTAALLAHGNELVNALRADLADPAAVLASLEVTQTLDLTRPAAAIFGCVLHFFDAAQAAKIVAGYAGTLVPGSYLVASVGSGDPQFSGKLASEYTAATVYNHSQDDIRDMLDGLEVVDPPGVADAMHWAPGVPAPVPSPSGGHVLAVVARTGT